MEAQMQIPTEAEHLQHCDGLTQRQCDDVRQALVHWQRAARALQDCTVVSEHAGLAAKLGVAQQYYRAAIAKYSFPPSLRPGS